MKGKILSVESVSVSILKSNPPYLYVTANGTVNSSGWREGELSPRSYLIPPEDGIWDFDFIATRPAGIVLHVLSTIVSAPFISDIPAWFRGVRIHASVNTVSSHTDINRAPGVTASYIPHASNEGGGDAWPWLVGVENAVDIWPWKAASRSAGVTENLPTCLSGAITGLSPFGFCMDGATHQLNTIFAGPVRLKPYSDEVAAVLEGFKDAKVIVSVCGNWPSGAECRYLEVYSVSLTDYEVSNTRHVVIALTASLPAWQRCAVIPAGSIYPAIYSVVFGPATEAECRQWVGQHCGQ